jgi:type VI secretion system protein ImpH
MAAQGRQQNIDLKKLLLDRGREIPFVQVLRLLRLLLASSEIPDHDSDRMFDFIRIRPELGLRFPGTDVVQVEEYQRDQDVCYRVTATFMGLYGSSSPLPTFYTEDLIEERRNDGSITREFIDIFNNSFYTHFFRIWEKYTISHRLAENPGDAKFKYLYALLGLSGSHVRHSLAHHKDFLSYIGLACQAPRSAAGLETLIRDLLGLNSVEIEQCVEEVTEIPLEQRCFLGKANSILGEDSHLGCRIRDMSARFILRIGLLDGEQLQTLLPDAPAYELIREAVRFYLDQPLGWDIELEVMQDHLSTTRPGVANWGKLGWNTWLFSGSRAPGVGRVLLSGSG